MSKDIAKPFRYRNGWRAQVTIKNGGRPSKDFATHAEAKAWIADMLANNNAENSPLLGGPTQARLADMLDYYVRNVTVAKGGAVQEINRANHYLTETELPELALWNNADGQKEVVTLAEKHAKKRQTNGDEAVPAGSKRQGTRNEAGVTPAGFAKHNDERSREAHPRTFALYATLANKRASQITGADMRTLHSTMTAEGYSASTIQKEIALLKTLFNETKKWSWPVRDNPCDGIKLKQGNRRFIVFTDEQRAQLVEALGQCDNPQFWPLVDFTIETALRQSSLLRLEWEGISLKDRKVYALGKGHPCLIPLSKRAVQILEQLPGPREGVIFTMAANAIQNAWARVREKAGLPKLLFRDLRHVAPTSYARGGLNAFQIRDILGHKTTNQADIYVNLANQDTLDAMDRIDAKIEVALPLPPNAADWDTLKGQNKTRRLKKVDIPIVVVEHNDSQAPAPASAAQGAEAPVVTPKPVQNKALSSNIIAFKPRSTAARADAAVADTTPAYAKHNGS